MIIEAAILNIKENEEMQFEKSFHKAKSIISSMKGFISLQLNRCIEHKSRYLLLVKWHTIDDHENGFRKSAEYIEWKNLLHHYYSPFPIVEHFENIIDI